MNWSEVGDFIKDNAGNGAALIGTLLTGGTGPAIAAAISMVSSATGTNDPEQALQALSDKPELMVKLEQIRLQRATEIDKHIETMELARINDRQKEHQATSNLMIEGQKVASSGFEKKSRPAMAWLCLVSTIVYGFYALVNNLTPDLIVLGTISGGYLAWMGLRSIDKRIEAKNLPQVNTVGKIKGFK